MNRWAPGGTGPWRSPGAPGRWGAWRHLGRSRAPGETGAAAGRRRNAGAPRVGPPRPQVLPGQAGGGSGGRGGGGRVNQAARLAGHGREWLPDRPDREAAGRRSAPAVLVLRPRAPGQVGPLPGLERGGACGRGRPRPNWRDGAGSARAPPGAASPGRSSRDHLGRGRATVSAAGWECECGRVRGVGVTGRRDRVSRCGRERPRTTPAQEEPSGKAPGARVESA